MEIKNLQLKVDNWIKNHGVRYFNELTNMAQLTEEVGEVARIISRKYGEQSFKDSDKDVDLAGELSDVLFVLLCLANQTGIIDSGYRGNIIGAFRNISGGPLTFVVEKHMRLLQICAPDLRPIIVEIVDENFFKRTSRNDGGFGSTGK